MTARPVPAVHGPDAQILSGLQHLVARGHYLKSWQPQDIVRVAYLHLPHSHTLSRGFARERGRALAAETQSARLRARIGQLEAENADLREQLHQGRQWPTAEVVTLTPKRGQVLPLLVAGAGPTEVAQELGMQKSAAANLCSRVVHDLHARDRADAIVKYKTGAVAVACSVKQQRRKAA